MKSSSRSEKATGRSLPTDRGSYSRSSRTASMHFSIRPQSEMRETYSSRTKSNHEYSKTPRNVFNELCQQWTTSGVLPEPLIEEKKPWIFTHKRGSLWGDYKTQINAEKESKDHEVTKQLWVNGLRKAFDEAKEEEEKKHKRRALIVSKFRKRRLQNALNEIRIDAHYKRKPLIFTPNADTPFNPYAEDVEEHTTLNPQLERLATPNFRPRCKTPGGSVCQTSENILRKIKSLGDIRKHYHWKNQVSLSRERPNSGYSRYSSRSTNRPFSGVSQNLFVADMDSVHTFEDDQSESKNDEMVWTDQFQLKMPKEACKVVDDIAKFERTLLLHDEK